MHDKVGNGTCGNDGNGARVPSSLQLWAYQHGPNRSPENESQALASMPGRLV